MRSKASYLIVAFLLAVSSCGYEAKEVAQSGTAKAVPITTTTEYVAPTTVPHITTTTTTTTTTTAPPNDIRNTSSGTPQKVPLRPSGSRWDLLADCETGGEWDYGPHSNWGSHIYEGGLQFHPDTWNDFGGTAYAPRAYQATREQQIVIAERVLASQGWKAWPKCSLELGFR